MDTPVSQGHSRTIVGADVVAGGGQRLLVLDPSHSHARCGTTTTTHHTTKPQLPPQTGGEHDAAGEEEP